MKTAVNTLVLCWLTLVSHATVRTVCNMAYTPGQFTTFTAALIASAANDTIYVHGSSINYGSVTINKTGIVVIGAGHNPTKTVPLVASFSTITVAGSNVQLIGLAIESISVNFTAGTVKRCKLQTNPSVFGMIFSPGTGDNWLIEGNVFLSSTFAGINFNSSSSTNTIIRNNVFNQSSAFAIGNSSLATAFTFQILNNLFLGNSLVTFGPLNNATINSNIFYRSSPQGTFTSCSMNNNISFQCSNNAFGASGSNNLVGVNPLLTNFPLAGALFDYTHDYHLGAGSPGIGNGADGTDRGLYGGFGTKFTMTGEPPIAEVTDFSITSPTTIAPGGTLSISVTAKRVN